MCTHITNTHLHPLGHTARWIEYLKMITFVQKSRHMAHSRDLSSAPQEFCVHDGEWSKCAACPGKDKAGCLKAKICSILTADQKAKVGTACGA